MSRIELNKAVAGFLFASGRHASVQSKSIGHHRCRNSRGLAGRQSDGRWWVRANGDLIVGLIGAFIGDWLLPRLGVHLGTGIVSLTINAFNTEIKDEFW